MLRIISSCSIISLTLLSASIYAKTDPDYTNGVLSLPKVISGDTVYKDVELGLDFTTNALSLITNDLSTDAANPETDPDFTNSILTMPRVISADTLYTNVRLNLSFSSIPDFASTFSLLDGNETSQTPWDVGGTLTMNEANQVGGAIVTIIETPFSMDRSRVDLAVGASPWRHQDGTLYFISGCGEQTSYVKVLDVSGTTSSASPCSDTVPNTGLSPTYFTYAMASPDKRRIAVETRWYDRDLQVHYNTVIFESNSVVATYVGYYAAAWLDNETLVLPSSDGLYKVDLGSVPQRLNSEITGSGIAQINNPDVSPNRERIVFEWHGAIWLVATDGSGLRQLADDAQNLRYPVWSPDGQFVAFLRIQAPGAFDHLLIPSDPLNLEYLANANERFVHFVQPDTLERWSGTLARHMEEGKMPQGQLSWLPQIPNSASAID